jgi:hypothetical protein
MKLFTKRQIEGALKARHLYETLGYPSNADFESVLQAGGIGGCTLTADDARVANKIWGDSVPRLKGSTVRAPAPAGMPGVSSVEDRSADKIPGVDLPDVAVVNEPTGVDMGGPQAIPPKTLCLTMLFLIRH